MPYALAPAGPVAADGLLPAVELVPPELLAEQAARPGTAMAVMTQAAIRPGFMVSPHISRLPRGCPTGLQPP
jgi:hypothetical protein